MADSYTKLGLGGVDLVRGKYYPNDQTVLGAQNAEMVLDKALGGRASLRKRGGLVEHGAAFGGGIFEMFEIRIIDEVLNGGGGCSGGTVVTMRPISDILNEGSAPEKWLPEPLFANLDEVLASDADLIAGTIFDGIGTNCKLGMTSVAFSGVATCGKLRIRAKYTDNGDGTNTKITIGVSTSSGTIGGYDNLRATTILTTSFQTFVFDLFTDLAYAGGSFDWTDVRVQLLGSNISGSSPFTNTVSVSWLELELMHA